MPETSSATIPDDFELFRRRAYQLTGVDLTSYKVPQMLRRLGTLLARTQVRSFAEYARVLEQDPQRRQEFRDFVTINVSEFFRDPDRYGDLERHVLPELQAGGRALRVWSAGCSIGAEPYSLAVVLREQAPHALHRVLATDIDETILQRAREGTGYAAADVRAVERQRLARWFAADASGRYAVAPTVRGLVTFQRHDLVRDPYPPGPFDLILCRNVVIYFTDDAKQRIYQSFAQVLRPGGYLFVGGTEVLMQPQALGLQAVRTGFYRKRAEA